MTDNCQSTQKQRKPSITTEKNSFPKSIQESEIQRATERGLQVDFCSGKSSSMSGHCQPPSPSGSMTGELNRLEIEKKEPEEKIKKYTWYQSSDDEDELNKMVVYDDAGDMDENDSDDDIL